MRKLVNTFIRTGTFRIIDICLKPKKVGQSRQPSGIKYGISVEDNGDICVFEGTFDTSGKFVWKRIRLNKVTIPEEVQS